MPPLPPPNTLAQLEEACRRLEEVSKPPKQRLGAVLKSYSACLEFSKVFLGYTKCIPIYATRHSTPGLQREKSHAVPVQTGAVSLQSQTLQTEQ